MMKNDLHHWLNGKTDGKAAVRIAVGTETDAWKKTAPEEVPPPAGHGTDRAEADGGTVVQERLMAPVVHSQRPERVLPAGRRRFSPIYSSLVVVSGAVLVGVLMGWTVWTLLVPFSFS